MNQPINVADYERLAEERLEPGPHAYFAGGAGDERTLRANLEAFRRWELRPRVLVDVSGCSAAVTVLGTEVSMPVLVAPVAFQRLAHPDGQPRASQVDQYEGACGPPPQPGTSRHLRSINHIEHYGSERSKLLRTRPRGLNSSQWVLTKERPH